MIATVLTWVLIAVVGLYFAVASYKIIAPIIRLYLAKGKTEIMMGKVVGHEGKEETQIGNEKVLTAYPVYGYIEDGKERRFTGLIRMTVAERSEGKSVEVLYEPEKGNAWAKDDMAAVKKTAIQRLALMAVLMVTAIVMGIMQ